jgi:hypothetical protein
MTRNVAPSCSPMSCSVQMCGWLSEATTRLALEALLEPQIGR